MSADNAIAILATRDSFLQTDAGCWTRLADGPSDVFRVAHIQGPDQFRDFLETEIHNLGWWMSQIFPYRKDGLFLEEEKALDAARRLARATPLLEHGIVLLDARPLNFPGA